MAGDRRANFPVGSQFVVSGSTGNDGTWTVAAAALNGSDTEITVTGNIASGVADGNITTTAVPSKTIIVDSGQLFLSRGIEVGDKVRNVTDGSEATVVTVDSNTQITTTPLSGGSLDRFRAGGTVVAGASFVPDALAKTKTISAVSVERVVG